MESERRLALPDLQGRRPAIDRHSRHDDDRESSSISEGDVFEVLCNRRRRQVLTYLQECDGRATAGELAESIAADEAGTTPDRVSSDERKRVYVSLYQNHLPVMDDASVVDYDADRKTVRLLATRRELDRYRSGTTDRPRQYPVIGGALGLAALVLLGGLQLGAFALTPAALWPVVGGLGLVGGVILGLYRPD